GMVLAKTDLGLAARYAELVPDPDLRHRVFDQITAEHERSCRMLLAVTGDDRLLADNPSLVRSIRNRFPYLEPLHHLQVEMLRRQWTAEGVAEAVLLAAEGIGPDTPAVLATAVAWGCDRVRDRPGGRGVVAVPPPDEALPVEQRFLHLAALAATRVETAVALA